MKKVLVIRLSSMGDIVLTQPVLEQIAKQGDTVDLFVLPEYASLGKMFPGVSQVITSIADLAPEYDVVLDLHGTLRARRVLRRIRAKQVIRYQKKALARRLLVHLGGRPWPWNLLSGLSRHEQVTEWYAHAAAKAGYAHPKSFPRIECSEWAHTAAIQTLNKAGISTDDQFIVCAPGAKWLTKQWPIEYFSQVAIQLQQEMGFIPVFVGSNAERLLCEQVAKAVGGRAVSLAGMMNLPTLGAVLSRADLVLANDSGPMHLALAANCRVITFLGPTVPEFGFAPLTNPHACVLSHDMKCRPCSLHGSQECPLQHHQCLRNISPEEAMQAAREMLGNIPKKRTEK